MRWAIKLCLPRLVSGTNAAIVRLTLHPLAAPTAAAAALLLPLTPPAPASRLHTSLRRFGPAADRACGGTAALATLVPPRQQSHMRRPTPAGRRQLLARRGRSGPT
jgi:hypothetical protein